jgi:hypothetical protein
MTIVFSAESLYFQPNEDEKFPFQALLAPPLYSREHVAEVYDRNRTQQHCEAINLTVRLLKIVPGAGKDAGVLHIAAIVDYANDEWQEVPIMVWNNHTATLEALAACLETQDNIATLLNVKVKSKFFLAILHHRTLLPC